MHWLAASIPLSAVHAETSSVIYDAPTASSLQLSAVEDEQKFLLLTTLGWPNAEVRWRYNDFGRSFLISPSGDDTLQRLQAAMGKWSAVCGVRFVFDGYTSTFPSLNVGSTPIVGWSILNVPIQGHTISANGPNGYLVRGDIEINLQGDPQMFDIMLLHEVGHMIGLAHSDVEGVVMSGANTPPLPSTAYTTLLSLQPDDIAGCRRLYGASSSGALPDLVVDSVSAGVRGATPGALITTTRTVVRNAGGAVAPAGAQVKFYWSLDQSISTADYFSGWSCALSQALAPGDSASCTGTVGAPPTSGVYFLGAYVNESRALAEQNYSNNTGYDPLSVAVALGSDVTTDLIEFYHPTLDYYFITSRANEIALLDGTPPFRRTGQSFHVYTVPIGVSQVGTSQRLPITRFYFDRVAVGGTRGSHFYTLVSSELSALQALNPTNAQLPRLPFNEGIDSYAYAPLLEGVGGFCDVGLNPVYRLFRGNVRFPDNPNHRFTASISTYNAFVAQGWDGEGVKVCVPR